MTFSFSNIKERMADLIVNVVREEENDITDNDSQKTLFSLWNLILIDETS